ncbi:uncharacterized protein LOC134267853 [Saccostrea cucullata]|uniref:uncharacterized protein LOC134267853 n=1 Tax=Saccostrea cuccullata TaxID=36930 RepID=UPI002ED2EBA9
MIFWQDIQKQRIYGSHLKYIVSICPLVNTQNCTMETERSYVRFIAPAQQEVTARIWSQNEIGMSRDFAFIRIPTEDKLLPPPEVVVSTNGTSTVLYWKATHSHKDNKFTIYWCHGDYKNLHLLQGVQNTSLTRNHDRLSYFKYGVSVVHNETTSGIKWATCVIRNNKFSRPPEVSLVLLKHTHINIVWRMPRCNMYLLSELIDKFVLTICDDPNCTGMEMVKVAADVTSYMYTINQKNNFCAKVEVKFGGNSQTSDIECLRLENTFHFYLAAIPVVIVVVLCLLILAALLGKTIKRWNSNIEIEVPEIGCDQKLLNGAPCTSDSKDVVLDQTQADSVNVIKDVPEDRETEQTVTSYIEVETDYCDNYTIIKDIDSRTY